MGTGWAVINSLFEYRGHARVIEAITRSYQRFISVGYRHRARDETTCHHHGLCILWQCSTPMVLWTPWAPTPCC